MGLLGQAQRGTHAVNILLKINGYIPKTFSTSQLKLEKNIYVIFENMLRIGDLAFLKLYQIFF